MEWTERETQTRQQLDVSEARARILNEEKRVSLPVFQKESDGAKPFEKVDFQPIKGVGTFEAEFGVKGEDVLYHFWPWGHHEVERKNGVNEDGPFAQRLPRFPSDFEKTLSHAMAAAFGQGRCDVKWDPDMNAWFVRANGYGTNQFHRDLCIQAAQILHKAMGGKD